MIRSLVLLLIILLAACRPASPVPPTSIATVTPAPTATLTPQPTATATPNPTATPTLSPTPSTEEFIFADFDYLAVFYDPAEWMSEKGMGQGFLIHQRIAGCQISDQHPEAMPAAVQARTIGALTFQEAQLKDEATKSLVIWYRLGKGLEGLPSGAQPFVVVSGPLEGSEACIQAAEDVLGSLHKSGL